MSKRTFFGKKDDEDKKEKQIALVDQDNELEKEISLLTKEDKGSIGKVISEVEGTIKEATKASIRDVKLLEEGRCPSCGRKTRPFLFTTVCEYCGWSTFITPEQGHALIHLKDGNVVESKSIFKIVQGDLLGITDDVVRIRIPTGNISYIEYAWSDEEIAGRREQRRREERVVCDWCQKEVERDEYVAVTYAAIGTQQVRYQFCSEKCRRSFEKQYPMRIHRNCYETSCAECNECVKKYEDKVTLEKLEEKKERPEKKA
ncbi:MAG: hypothetical protein KAJ05_02255 [Candidatus Latescibacteria bacterium]|nr:hypothetical protein [Candidatus Latescibacterota bacterium]MCK5329122.1 hypothetical protein [Candidatus Latescibacterota bacterium]MCK5381839.1 hypothetical protein [Candidatus Latescibacterota bacterium]MCK5525942.1 hypothetical protein [Candidatus Latescibacterota bacterium]